MTDTVCSKKVLCITLSQVVHLAPQQTKVVKATVQQQSDSDSQSTVIGVVTPSEDVLAKQQCDIEETLWTGESSTQVVISNWGLESQTIEEGQIVGEVQPGTVVDEDDPVWNDTSVDEALCVWHIQESTSDESARRLQLQEQLQIGSQNTDGERKQLEELLLGMSDVFALQDSELGETDLVTHTIDTESA